MQSHTGHVVHGLDTWAGAARWWRLQDLVFNAMSESSRDPYSLDTL